MDKTVICPETKEQWGSKSLTYDFSSRNKPNIQTNKQTNKQANQNDLLTSTV